MGSDSSKETPPKEPKRQQEDDIKFRYGPASNLQGNNKVDHSRIQSAAGAVNIQELKSASPPPYTACDPFHYPARPAYNQPSIRQPHQTVPAPRINVGEPHKYCVICHQRDNHEAANCPLKKTSVNSSNPRPMATAGVAYQNAPPIPPLPQQDINNPYKWSASQSNARASLPLHVTTSLASPNQTPSPSYDPLHNPYVWKPASPGIIDKPSRKIDLNLELPKIQQAIKQNPLPSFQHFNKELYRNKPLSDIRKSMVNNKYLSDVKLIVGESVFFAHKTILITASFLFHEHFHVKGETELKIDSIDPETFHKVIAYCYTDKIQVTEADVLELLLAANILQVRQITNVCYGFISNVMNPESIFIIFEKALELGNELFQKKCLEFIGKNEEKCFTSKGFYAISLPSLMKILDVCKYPREKSSEIVEKWTNGAMGLLDEPVLVPPTNEKPTGAVKNPEKKNKQVKSQPDNNQQAKNQAENIEQQKKAPKPKKQQQKPLIPDLMSLPIPNSLIPPMMMPAMQFQNQQQPFMPPPFMNPNFANFRYKFEPDRPFASPQRKKSEPLICIDDDDRDSIISKDDEPDSKVKVGVVGPRQKMTTEFSRLDFFVKRSMLIHEIVFSENLAVTSTEVRVTISVFEQNKWNNIHSRQIINKPGMKMNFVRFSREPLRFYIGQKFVIKLNFNEPAQRLNVNPEKTTANDFVELYREPGDSKKYFNCISSLLITDLSAA